MCRNLMLMLLPAWIVSSTSVLAGDRIDFSREIRPLLSDRCFTCHGTDAAKRKGDLRLDERTAALKQLGSGSRAIVPGKPDESELVARVESDEATEQMPPPDSGKALAPQERALLRRWVEEGAEYGVHWAFVAPARPELPAVKSEGWCRNAIDQFVLARLEQEKMRTSREADRVTLLRRLSLDLIGLPPTVEEVDAYLADDQEGAYERQVERLLESPHFGERWGRIWLDAARYADSDGYEKDKPRFVAFYRDWVVNAFNEDMPYNQFVIEQIAGDLLPEATQDQRVATGFLRNSMINEEGGVDPEQFRMEAMFDRMDAIGTGILGLTVRCAQCHSHKYDPLTQEEYYRMFACLNGSYEGSITVYSAEERQQRARILAEIRAIEEEQRASEPRWPARMLAWEGRMRGLAGNWTVVRPELDSSGDQKHYLLEDGSILAQGYAPTKHTTSFTAKVEGGRLTGVKLELMTDPDLPREGPGRSIKGLCALSEIRLTVVPPEGSGKAVEVKFSSASADVNPPVADLEAMFDDRSGKRRLTGPVTLAIDGKDDTAWTPDVGPGRSNVGRKAVFVLKEPIEVAPGSRLTFRLTQNHGGWNSDDNQTNNLGRFRLSITGDEAPLADPLSELGRQALEVEAKNRSQAQQDALFEAFRQTVPEWRASNERIERLWSQHPAGSSQLVLHEQDNRRKTAILERGDFLKPTRPVEPGVPAFLNPAPDGPMGRLEFARWLVDERSPTTARAFVNRVWQAEFGAGLVETAEDFGMQGAAPSHPELLDWLTVEFMERGWSVKQLLRTIVQSATYRQESRVSPEQQEKDPFNRLLGRGARFRVDGEVVRDIALAASGLLDPAVGGEPVHPPAPAFLFEPPTSYGPKVWQEDKGPERYRRALYTFRFRSVPYPALQVFDVPNGDVACVRRSRSNTPLQALTGMNEPLFLECARALGRLGFERADSTDALRLSYVFRRCVSRSPADDELAVLEGLLARQTVRFEEPGARPWALAAADAEHPPALPDGVSPARAAAWTAVARVLLNLDETVTRE